jgi:DNA-binding winged helix-turn-helix (wHTH) protein
MHLPGKHRGHRPAAPRLRYRVGDLLVDDAAQEVHRGTRHIELPRLSYRLLLALVEVAPGVLSHDAIVNKVWSGRIVSPEAVTQRIKLLRQALDDDAKAPRYVALVRGEGYRLLADVELLDPPVRGPTPWVAGSGHWHIAVGVVDSVALLPVSHRRDERPGSRAPDP